MANDKMTNVKALEKAIATLEANTPVDVEVIEKLKNIKTSYEKKSASNPNRKPTKTQTENIEIGKNIRELMEVGKRYTVTDLVKLMDNEYTSQKLSPIVNKLVDDVTFVKEVEKRVTYFVRKA